MTRRRPLPLQMYVPPDAFGGESPERKAARGIRCVLSPPVTSPSFSRLTARPPAPCSAMHTYVAAHVVAAQLMNVAPRINTLDGTDGGSGQDGAHESSRIAQGYDLIMSFLAENPVRRSRGPCLARLLFPSETAAQSWLAAARAGEGRGRVAEEARRPGAEHRIAHRDRPPRLLLAGTLRAQPHQIL